MITILRLGHRKDRDHRISTHCGLVSRAFGADKIIYSGERDKQLTESIKKATKRWGGPFNVEYNASWKGVIKKHKKKRFVIVHLSMYGTPFNKKIAKIKKTKKILVIIGSQKVPGEVYKMADFNLAIGNQPHSEVAALGIFLYELSGRKLDKKFKKAKITVIPCERGKVVRNTL